MKFEFHLTKVNSTTEIRLHYAPDERRFVLNEKGKIDPYSFAYQGKMLETFETLLYSSDSDKDRVDEHLDRNVLDCPILFIDDKSILMVDKKILVFDNACVSESIDRRLRHGNLNLSIHMRYTCSIMLIIGLQACLRCYLLFHGYSFQWTQLPLVPFDRGKSSSFDFLDSRTNLFEEGGNDTSHKGPTQA